MGVTRRAARLCFAALLIGAGAAAVAAKPSSQPRIAMVKVEPGDARLDLEWALAQSGMPADDARRVSVLLVDQVDPNGELQTLNTLWAAELWWREPDPETGAPVRMMRAYLAFRTGAMLDRIANESRASCETGSQRYFSMRVTSSRIAPIPSGASVLVRLNGLGLCGRGSGIDGNDLQPAGPGPNAAGGIVLCESVMPDPESGLDVPLGWATNE